MNAVPMLVLATDDNVQFFTLKNHKCNAKAVSIHDGDTLRLVIIYFDRLIKFTCRLYGYDSPEISDTSNPDSWKATNALAAAVCNVKFDEDKPHDKKEWSEIFKGNSKLIIAEFLGSDKYGRELVKLYSDDNCINDMLLDQHEYNIKYTGRGPRPIHIPSSYSK